MTCLAKNEIYSLKWEKCARCAKMRRLVGARVIFLCGKLPLFVFGCPSPSGQNKKVQFTTNQCYITNKSSFFAKNWTKSPDWGWKNCQSGIPLPIFETKQTSGSGSGCSRHQSSLSQNGRAFSTVFHISNDIFSKNNVVQHP